jgi:hypothetical protein
MEKNNDKPTIKQPGSLVWPFRLGDKARDKINGLEGTLIARFYHMTGCDRFTLEFPAEGNKPGDLCIVDGNRLELVETYPDRHRSDEVPEGLHIKLGDECKSLIQGLIGTATIIHVPLYGAIQVTIDPKWDPKKKEMPEGYFVDAAFVEVTKPYTPGLPKAQPSPAIKETRGACRMPSNVVSR